LLIGMTGETLFDTIPSEISDLLVDFSDSIEEINKLLVAYKDALKTCENEASIHKLYLPKMQRVQIELSLTYTMNALFYVYLRCHGVDTSDHPIVSELQRLTACLKRCQSICSKQSNENQHAHLDKEATKRFVKRALWQSVQAKPKRRKMDLD
uniref:Nuclear nucleic acid-binding protein C1D n=1 Tax=Rodentolepis nana TaxID=102285 RepID=A0A0R3T0P5_RODNA